MKTLVITGVLLLFMSMAVHAQGGGKAEPNRIEFSKGRTSAILSATLGRDEEMEYVFSAKAGQNVTIRNTKTSLFDVRVFSDENNIETEFDSSPTFSLKLPEDGEYFLFVRKKRVKTPARARFSVTLTIK